MTRTILLTKFCAVQELKRHLEEHFEDIDAIDSSQATALHYAIENENIHCVKLLTDFRANPFIRNSYGLISSEIAKETGNIEVCHDFFLRQVQKPFILDY